jgi:hypothetical protein
VPHGLFGPDRQIASQDLGAAVAQHLGNVHGLRLCHAERTVVGIVLHVRGDAVEHRPHGDPDAVVRKRLLENLRAVGQREYRVFERLPDLAPVHVECGHDTDVVDPVTPYEWMHDPRDVGAVTVSVVLESLDERAGTVAHARDG